jgi:hypothetical protein
MRILLIFVLAMPALLEDQAIKAVNSSTAVYEEQMAKHFECHGSKEMTHTPLCDALNQIPRARERVTVALDFYCSAKDYLNTSKGKVCKHNAAASAELTAAVSNLSAITAKAAK